MNDFTLKLSKFRSMLDLFPLSELLSVTGKLALGLLLWRILQPGCTWIAQSHEEGRSFPSSKRRFAKLLSSWRCRFLSVKPSVQSATNGLGS